MSNKLSPLEAFNKIMTTLVSVYSMQIFPHPDNPKMNEEEHLRERYNVKDIENALKALEIIKEKEWFDDFMKEHLTREWFTKDELDLLKEVLL